MWNRACLIIVLLISSLAFPSCVDRKATLRTLYDENSVTIIGSPDLNNVRDWDNAKENTVIIVGNPNDQITKSEPVTLTEGYCPVPRKDISSQILHRKGYTVSYNKETLQPNWVAWHLTADHTDGEWARPSGNAFHEDSEVPSPRASNYDYKGSGWSRGHMCPAADNRWDDVAMYESFLLTNVCPQHDRLNSGDWNDIEQECRRWAKKFGGIYIVCGPIFYHKDHETIGVNKIPVPEAFFKVILCMEGKPKGIGFICKNTEGNHKTDFYVNTIRQVERITGFDFFSQLPDEIEKLVESEAQLNNWY